jgi:hypothetical protein
VAIERPHSSSIAFLCLVMAAASLYSKVANELRCCKVSASSLHSISIMSIATYYF